MDEAENGICSVIGCCVDGQAVTQLVSPSIKDPQSSHLCAYYNVTLTYRGHTQWSISQTYPLK